MSLSKLEIVRNNIDAVAGAHARRGTPHEVLVAAICERARRTLVDEMAEQAKAPARRVFDAVEDADELVRRFFKVCAAHPTCQDCRFGGDKSDGSMMKCFAKFLRRPAGELERGGAE